jgi:REP element-mobilizing transposase RayT
MARKLRIQYAGAIYHVINRGDRREPIFEDDPDRERFLETLAEACLKTGWQVHAYCLMGNHFHLVLETPQANLVAGMQWFARVNRYSLVTNSSRFIKTRATKVQAARTGISSRLRLSSVGPEREGVRPNS